MSISALLTGDIFCPPGLSTAHSFLNPVPVSTHASRCAPRGPDGPCMDYTEGYDDFEDFDDERNDNIGEGLLQEGGCQGEDDYCDADDYDG